MPVDASASITISGSLDLGFNERDARDGIPPHERFLPNPMAFRVANVDQVALAVKSHQGDEDQR